MLHWQQIHGQSGYSYLDMRLNQSSILWYLSAHLLFIAKFSLPSFPTATLLLHLHSFLLNLADATSQ